MNQQPKWAELTQFGLLGFTGNDARAFLHGQLSCDVERLGAGHACYGSYNTPQGRVLASFLLWCDVRGYFMQLPRSLCTSICQRMAKFILRSKVKAADLSAEHTLIGVAGGHAATILKAMFSAIPKAPLTLSSEREANVLRLDAQRFVIAAPIAQAPALRAALAKDAAAVGESAWDWLDIRAGIPYVTPATQERFVPQAANLDLIGGVSFEKGCYPGQEIVARMHFRGKLKERMYLAHIAAVTAPRPGDRLYSAEMGDQATGTIVNAAPSSGGGYDALAVIHISSVHAGNVRLGAPDGPLLTFLPLPYQP